MPRNRYLLIDREAVKTLRELARRRERERKKDDRERTKDASGTGTTVYKNMKRQISTTISAEEFQKWTEVCKRENKTSFQLLRECIQIVIESVPVPAVPPPVPPDNQ